MIGQKKLQSEIKQLIDNNKFPQFSILVGAVGSGKKLLANLISQWLCADYRYTVADVKVDSIREMISDAVKIKERAVYVVPDADIMSMNAKNALLKIVEEPPRNAYFIMTLQDINNTLSTIKSRGAVFNMNLYASSELYEYANQALQHTLHENEWELIQQVYETPGEIKNALSVDSFITNFYDYVALVVDNIAEVEPANAFKSSNKLALKTDEGYDLSQFFKMFTKVCFDRWRGNKEDRFLNAIQVSSEYLSKLKVGTNRQQLYDMWVLDIREALWT